MRGVPLRLGLCAVVLILALSAQNGKKGALEAVPGKEVLF